MFDEQQLASTEFYRRRYTTYSTIIIIPITIGLIILVIFALFTNKELTVKSVGEIAPKSILSTVQSTSNQKIQKLNLHENQTVQKGETLITYENSDTQASKKLLAIQLSNEKARLKALNDYESSVSSGKSIFQQADTFGYSNLFNNYQEQISELNASLKQANDDRTNSNNQAETQKRNFTNDQNKVKDLISQYNQIISAVQNGTSIDTTNSYKYLYDSFNSQLSGLSLQSDKDKLRQDTIAELNKQIDSLSSSATGLREQADAVNTTNIISPDQTLLQIQELKSKTLADIKNQEETTQNSINTIIEKKSETADVAKTLTVKAQQAGIIHLNTNLTKTNYIPGGSNVASIYPMLTKETKLTVVFYITSSEISNIKNGQKIRYSIVQDVPRPMVINGIVTQIDNATTQVGKGSYYKVVAEIPKIKSQDIEHIRYGTQGKVAIITGEKTWFNYIKDKVLDK
ncbi:bacteriocin secretion accessory protein [Weissella muntiaci]|uniref:Bacteriocin secretion accessory protein n=1 Tax=Weissella muntiaci TaxID=2508881 RepID=A0A6C2CB49_9LACO|nr:bacteriocin secretion accessory protein [Weissella muntiaci]TYC50563.1 bacteriocin secretion accessory protein [Weissella muntiaci]